MKLSSRVRFIRMVCQAAHWGKPSISRAWAEVAMPTPSASMKIRGMG
jgi:hypothetical protein